MADHPETPTIGASIRAARRYRGMSIETLAGMTGLSKGYLSMVENGHRQMDRRSHLEAVADALQVSLTDLTGQPYKSKDPAYARALAAVPALRTAILDTSFDEQPDRPARPMETLRRATAEVEAAREAGANASFGPVLPNLIEELHVHAGTSDAGTQPALRALVGAYRSAVLLCHDLGYVDLALMAADRMQQAADRLDDPAWSALGAWYRSSALIGAGSRRRSFQVAMGGADVAGRHLDRAQVMPMYGSLHLRAALAAVTSQDTSAVEAHLTEAAEIAGRTGENDAFRLHFGPTNVAAWRVAIAVEVGEGGKVAEITRRMDMSFLGNGRRRAHFYIDLGRGFAQARGKDAEALAALREAERQAPELVRAHPLARETVAAMLQRARSVAGGRDLRGLAYRLGVA
jgi:transcriptional regulator with XRE-family HTH domain